MGCRAAKTSIIVTDSLSSSFKSQRRESGACTAAGLTVRSCPIPNCGRSRWMSDSWKARAAPVRFMKSGSALLLLAFHPACLHPFRLLLASGGAHATSVFLGGSLLVRPRRALLLRPPGFLSGRNSSTSGSTHSPASASPSSATVLVRPLKGGDRLVETVALTAKFSNDLFNVHMGANRSSCTAVWAMPVRIARQLIGELWVTAVIGRRDQILAHSDNCTKIASHRI
jgi:hypothetical protein